MKTIDNSSCNQPTFQFSKLFNQSGLFWILIILWVALSFMSPVFFSTRNVMGLLMQGSTIAILGLGMTFVIISGGIDLSVGSIAALASMVTGLLMKAGLGFLVSCTGGLLVGVILGALNGILISKVKIPPLIQTLGMMTIARGLALVSTKGYPIMGIDSKLITLGMGRTMGVPNPVIITFLLAIISYIVLKHTIFGRYVYAVGGNQEAARISGVPVASVKTYVYVISGMAAAVAGLLLTGLLGASEPTVAQMTELDAIAVVIIGGTSLSGGEGRISGTIIGALLIASLKNGLNLLGVVSYYQQILIGAIIIGAVYMDQLRKNRTNSLNI